MKICPRCGQNNSNNNQYCIDCGEVLIKKRTDIRKEKTVVLTFGVIGVLLCLAGAFLVFKHTDNADPKDTSIVSESDPDSDSSSEIITDSEETEAESADVSETLKN